MGWSCQKKQPLVDNALITSPTELRDLVKKSLSQGEGGFLKIFVKDSNRYYITILFDRSKILAAECLVVDSNETLIGTEAVDILRSLLGRVMIADAYVLDEIEVKLSIAENVDIYAQTPKVPLENLTAGAMPEVPEREPAPPVEAKTETKIPVDRRKMEEEVNRLLKKTGVEELSVITEEKKRKVEKRFVKYRVEPAMKTLKNRLNSELKKIMGTKFKWVNVRYRVEGSTVKLDLDASFRRLRGMAYVRVSDEDIRRRILAAIESTVSDVSREHGIVIKPNRVNIVLE